jgi:hypothetical protein
VRIMAPPPRVVSISPLMGKPTGGEIVTINGAGFSRGSTASLGNQDCSNSIVISSTQMRCRAPANNQGNYSVSVRNPDGQSNDSGTAPVFQVVNPRWVATQGGVCSKVCTTVSLFSRLSPEGSYCTSGEQIPASAVGKVPYRYGCWPFKNCRAQGTGSSVSIGKYCYGASQRRDNGSKDITMGCYCSP